MPGFTKHRIKRHCNRAFPASRYDDPSGGQPSALRVIGKQIVQERERYRAISAELDLRGTELVNDLSPRFPANHRPDREGYGDDYIPATGHLTARGVEICYRLFDLGKSPMAVAYLMGMTLRSGKRRHQSWIKAGGLQRVRAEVERYDILSLRRTPPG